MPSDAATAAGAAGRARGAAVTDAKPCPVPLADMLDSTKRKGSMFDTCECGLSNSECSWNKIEATRPDGGFSPWPFGLLASIAGRR